MSKVERAFDVEVSTVFWTPFVMTWICSAMSGRDRVYVCELNGDSMISPVV